MAEFVQSIDIDRAPDEVFAFLMTLENEKLWQANLVEIEQTSPGPLAPGCTGREVRRSMGMKQAIEWKLTDLEPPRRFAFEVLKPMPFSATYDVQPVGAGTRVTMRARPVGASRYVWRLFEAMGRRQYAADFARLKAVLESAAAGDA